MDNLKDLNTTAEEVLGKLKSHQLFQCKWDIAAFIIFLIFLSTVLFLLLLVWLHCCCCRHPCSSRSQKASAKQENSVGVSNLTLEP
ncbi:PREDICTED: small integral membrane protein 22 [Miniopterus natalensis]|uniref:small integral membrane protein 22 n=1 Tax=Miniopterus natalensis TaxID=291302 RepID=UPI0007A729C2|nr:PREDICTED: small integral membrane protein 22 [Miniopterus natalensis]